MPEVWQQFRKLEAGSISATANGSNTDLDMRLNVREAKKEGLTFTATVWNISESTWGSVKKGDPVRIRLGWKEGVRSAVCFGVVTRKRTVTDGPDTEYILEGIDQSAAQVRKRRSWTWRDRSPNQIAADLALRVGLSVGEADLVGQTIPQGRARNYAIRSDQTVGYWMNQLRDEAQNITGEKWHWYCRSGKFYFLRKGRRMTQAVDLAYENTLIDLSEASGKSESESGNELEFEALCEPKMARDTLVNISTDKHSGIYKIVDVEFLSDTTTGDHLCRGTVAPADARYPHEYPGGNSGIGLGTTGVGIR